MEIKNKVAHLKGLMEGMKFDTESDNGKVIASVVDILEEMAKEIENLTADVDTLNEYADELDYDLGSLEEFVYDEDEDCCCCEECCQECAPQEEAAEEGAVQADEADFAG